MKKKIVSPGPVSKATPRPPAVTPAIAGGDLSLLSIVFRPLFRFVNNMTSRLELPVFLSHVRTMPHPQVIRSSVSFKSHARLKWPRPPILVELDDNQKICAQCFRLLDWRIRHEIDSLASLYRPTSKVVKSDRSNGASRRVSPPINVASYFLGMNREVSIIR